MIVQANSHLGFVCHDLDKSVQFYEEILGCKEKFSLYYGDMIPPTAEERAQIPPEVMARLETVKDVRWIVYLEWMDGYFIELPSNAVTHPQVGANCSRLGDFYLGL